MLNRGKLSSTRSRLSILPSTVLPPGAMNFQYTLESSDRCPNMVGTYRFSRHRSTNPVKENDIVVVVIVTKREISPDLSKLHTLAATQLSLYPVQTAGERIICLSTKNVKPAAQPEKQFGFNERFNDIPE